MIYTYCAVDLDNEDTISTILFQAVFQEWVNYTRYNFESTAQYTCVSLEVFHSEPGLRIR